MIKKDNINDIIRILFLDKEVNTKDSKIAKYIKTKKIKYKIISLVLCFNITPPRHQNTCIYRFFMREH